MSAAATTIRATLNTLPAGEMLAWRPGQESQAVSVGVVQMPYDGAVAGAASLLVPEGQMMHVGEKRGYVRCYLMTNKEVTPGNWSVVPVLQHPDQAVQDLVDILCGSAP